MIHRHGLPSVDAVAQRTATVHHQPLIDSTVDSETKRRDLGPHIPPDKSCYTPAFVSCNAMAVLWQGAVVDSLSLFPPL